MVDFPGDDGTFERFEAFEDGRIVVFEDTGHQVLTQGQDSAATQVHDLDFLGYFLAHFEVVLDLAGFRQRDLRGRVFHRTVLDHDTVAPYLKVALVGIDHDIEIVVGAVFFLQRGAEHLLQDGGKSQAVDFLELLEFRKRIYQCRIVHFDQ